MKSPRFDHLGVLVIVDCPCGGNDDICEHVDESVVQADWIYALVTNLAVAGGLCAAYEIGHDVGNGLFSREQWEPRPWKPNAVCRPAPGRSAP